MVETVQPVADGLPIGAVGGWLSVPYEVIGGYTELLNEKEALTFTPRYADAGDDPIRMFEDRPNERRLLVPRAYGLHRFDGAMRLRDRRTLGEEMHPVPRLPDPNHPSVLDPAAQARFMSELEAAAREHHHFLAEAPTGSGKTVCALRTAAVIGRKTIVMVHLERLMDQWCDSAHNILGVPENRIGTVQGDKCDWRGKDFVIAMMPSLAMRPYEPDFYRAFGTAIYDEVHRVGAPLLSLTAHLFPALYRWGFSATLGRKDGGERIYYWHIGPVRVVSDAAALPMTVYVKKFTTVRKLWGKNHGSRMQCLSRDPERNAALTSIIVRFYRQGRHALIIGESIRHLQHLMARAVRAGVPATAMGQFTSERVTLEDYVTDKGERKTRVRKTVIRPEELEEVKAESQIIFATYGMMIEGIDIPRLDAGMDVTPRSDATQLIGRIRRPVPGKKRPVWVTFLDTRCFISRRYYEKRCRDYIATGVDIVDGKL